MSSFNFRSFGGIADNMPQPSPSTPPHLQKRKQPKQKQVKNPLSRGIEKSEGPSALQPTTPYEDNMPLEESRVSMIFPITLEQS